MNRQRKEGESYKAYKMAQRAEEKFLKMKLSGRFFYHLKDAVKSVAGRTVFQPYAK